MPRRRTLLAGGATVLLLAAAGGVLAAASAGGSPAPAERRALLPVTDGPAGDQHVVIDTDVFTPAGVDAANPAPAVILSHGFGGSLDEVRGDALDAARRGYVVLTYSARGFGKSTGLVGLDSPDYEVKDVHQLVDLLAGLPQVRKESPGDPLVGLGGGSYGGGISLLAAAYDPRVDAVAAAITWNDLATAFAPNGVFKQGWASDFFGLGTLGSDAGPAGKAGGAARRTPQVCPGFVPEVCAAYADTQAAGIAPPSALATLHRSSIASVGDRLKVPTLLMQGERDTLFPLSEARATSDLLARNGVPHQEVWLAGGHDGGFGGDTRRVRDLTATWFDAWLRDKGVAADRRAPTGAAFQAARAGAPVLTAGSDATAATLSYHLASAAGRGTLVSAGPPGPTGGDGPPLTLVNPPGGSPAALTTLPGLGALSSLAPGLTLDLPPQTVTFDGPTLQSPLEVVGGGGVRFAVTSSTGTAVLFVKLVDVDADGTARLPFGQLTPLRLTGLPTASAGSPGRTVDVALPLLSYRFATGHHVRLTVATTDQAWLGNRVGASYTIAPVPGAGLTVQLSPAPAGGGLRPLALAGLVALVLLALGGVAALVTRRARRRTAVVTGAAALGVAERTDPLVLTGLTKAYPGGFTAVDDLDLRVESGMVLGLLGPNGAGKTTTLRMVLGLIHPTAGEIRLFGTRVLPGSPALARVGAFVEGPGFVPTLAGLDNLRLWWTASGSDWADAHSEEAIEVAGLGDAIHRRVKTYSQGMRQRLAIAQAMLGRPDLVVLDEPTNGLDPPQIVAMRRVIRDLADRGTTVVVSSHQLSEVEQVCSHVAVMSKGRLVAQGTVDEVIGADRAVHVEVPAASVGQAEDLVRRLAGVLSVDRDATGLLVALDGLPRPELVAALVTAGVPVAAVTPRRALEAAFLELVS